MVTVTCWVTIISTEYELPLLSIVYIFHCCPDCSWQCVVAHVEEHGESGAGYCDSANVILGGRNRAISHSNWMLLNLPLRGLEAFRVVFVMYTLNNLYQRPFYAKTPLKCRKPNIGQQSFYIWWPYRWPFWKKLMRSDPRLKTCCMKKSHRNTKKIKFISVAF